MGNSEDALLREQLAYYRARAGEYDRVYAEREDLASLLTLVDGLPVGGHVLELACGTGQWTDLLAARARSVTAIDAAPEVLDIAREHTVSPLVRFELADVFTWSPPRRFDTVFFAFWLSHVPPARLPAFWETVAAALAPGGRAIFIDTGAAEEAAEEVLEGQPAPAVRRRLDDGSEYRIVKVFHDAERLTGDLAALGWSVRVLPAGGNFIVGIAERPDAAG